MKQKYYIGLLLFTLLLILKGELYGEYKDLDELLKSDSEKTNRVLDSISSGQNEDDKVGNQGDDKKTLDGEQDGDGDNGDDEGDDGGDADSDNGNNGNNGGNGNNGDGGGKNGGNGKIPSGAQGSFNNTGDNVGEVSGHPDEPPDDLDDPKDKDKDPPDKDKDKDKEKDKEKPTTQEQAIGYADDLNQGDKKIREQIENYLKKYMAAQIKGLSKEKLDKIIDSLAQTACAAISAYNNLRKEGLINDKNVSFEEFIHSNGIRVKINPNDPTNHKENNIYVYDHNKLAKDYNVKFNRPKDKDGNNLKTPKDIQDYMEKHKLDNGIIRVDGHHSLTVYYDDKDGRLEVANEGARKDNGKALEQYLEKDSQGNEHTLTYFQYFSN